MGPRVHAFKVEIGIVYALGIAAVFHGVQLFVGCRWEVCFGFTLALFFGWCACVAAGTWRSLLGLLTISFYVKTVLFGCVVKTLLLQPMDVGLEVPVETSVVFALGFAAVFLAVLLQHALPRPALPFARTPANSPTWLSLLFLFLVLGGAAWALRFHSRIDFVTNDKINLGDNFELTGNVGRAYQVVEQIAMYFPFAPAVALFYVAARGAKKLIAHPLVITTLLITMVPGFLEGRKTPIMVPLASVCLSLLLLRGPRYKPLWVWSAVSLVFLVCVIFPFVQYTRYAVQQGSLAERISTIEEVAGIFSDRRGYKEIYSAAVEMDITHAPYLPLAANSLERFIRYVDASRLIAATVHSEKYTGFYTLAWGLRQIPPRTIYPDKPLGFINNWLSRYTGDVGPESERTQFAYGFMASLFNAYGYPGVLFGSFFLYGALLYWMRLFIEDRAGPTIWVVVGFFLFENSLVEDSAGAMLRQVWLPVYIASYSVSLNFCSKFLLDGLLRRVRVAGGLRSRFHKQLFGGDSQVSPMKLHPDKRIKDIP